MKTAGNTVAVTDPQPDLRMQVRFRHFGGLWVGPLGAPVGW